MLFMGASPSLSEVFAMETLSKLLIAVGIFLVVAVGVLGISAQGVRAWDVGMSPPPAAWPKAEGRGVVGGERDVHGCLGAAGYAWCQEKQKCLRTWEESCGK